MRKSVLIPVLGGLLATAALPTPASYTRYLGEGERALLNGRYPDAVKALGKALKYQRSIRVYNDLFLAYGMLDEFERARAAQNKAIALAKRVKDSRLRNLMLAEFYSGLVDLTVLEEEVLHERDFNSEEEAEMFLGSKAYQAALKEVMLAYDKVLRYGRYEKQFADVNVEAMLDRVVTDREDKTLKNLDLLRNAIADYFGRRSGNLPGSLNELARYMKWRGVPHVYPPKSPSTNRVRNYPGIYIESSKSINAKKIKNTRGWGYDPISGHIFVDLKDRDLDGNYWYQN